MLCVQEISFESEQVQVLREEVRKMLAAVKDKPLQKLSLIDAIQLLGIFYHFEREIEEALQKIYDTQQDDDNDDNLYTIALQFRLLRQHGYSVSCGMFNFLSIFERYPLNK